MKKKFVKWIITSIILPLIQDILIEFGKSLLKYLLDIIKDKMHNWKKTEEENAKTEEEKIFIRKKWDERIEDIENLKYKMDESVDKIVKNALENSEEKMKIFNIIESKDSKLIS